MTRAAHRPSIAAAILHAILAALATGLAHAQTELPELNPPVRLEIDAAPERGASRFPLLPEGAYLSERLARLRQVGTHASAVVFIRAGADEPLRPMALLPSANTQAMEQLAGAGDGPAGDVLFEVSGQVFTSRGMNFFLPLLFRVVSDEERETRARPAAPMEPEPEPEVDPPLLAENPVEVEVESLIRELEAATAAAEAERTAGAGRPAMLQREGGVVTLRRGRVLRGASGGWVFAFDNGVASLDGGPVDEPMGLMPCSLLDEMASIASRRGEHVTMTVSGRVFLYGQQNYLLPTMFFVNRSGEGGLTSAH